MDIFLLCEPCKIDLLAFMDANVDGRWNVYRWDRGPSDVEGCDCLSNPTAVVPSVKSMNSPKIPALCLLDRLRDGEWVGESTIAHHGPEAARVYDDRNMAGKRAYLRCLLAAEEMYAAGITFSSGMQISYYMLLLHTE